MNKKNILSIAIILIAGAIIFVNLNKSSKQSGPKETGETAEIANRTTAVEEKATDEKEETAGASQQVQEGSPAPNFELKTIDGKSVSLSDYKGKKVILNFWATWCPPCKAEMPHMQQFYESKKDRNIEILAVNLTSMDKGLESVKTFKQDYGITFQIPLDEDGNAGIKYQAFTIPTSYIIDSKGIIRNKIVGPMDEEMMTNLTSNIE